MEQHPYEPPRSEEGSPDPATAASAPGTPFSPLQGDTPTRIGWVDGHMPDIVEPLVPRHPENALTETRRLRHDGWTPEKKRAFLECFAACGVIVEACQAAGMSARAAYNLRGRDPLFAAGWDAAAVKARDPLADEVYARARNGVVERIYKDGLIVAERHRYDNRLTMAVLARLDSRIHVAELTGAAHLGAVARWDEYLDALGEDRRDDGAALLAAAPPPRDARPAPDTRSNELRELHELVRLKEVYDACLDRAGSGDEERAMEHQVWVEADKRVYTNYPPPADFTGEQDGEYGDADYRRVLSPSEQSILDSDKALDRAEAEAERDDWFRPLTDDDSGAKPPKAKPPAAKPPGGSDPGASAP
jgi:hypothetical protein